MAAPELIVFGSSNQHLNPYKGQPPGTTEEKVMQDITIRTIRYLQNATTGTRFENYWKPGHGTSSVDELNVAIAQINKSGAAYCISLHSDAIGDAAVTGVLPITAVMATPALQLERDRVAVALSKHIAAQLGWPVKTVRHKKFNILQHTVMPAFLLELSEHATVAEAAWIVEHKDEIAAAVGEAIIKVFGLTRKVVELPKPTPVPATPPPVSNIDLVARIKALEAGYETVSKELEDGNNLFNSYGSRLAAVENSVTVLQRILSRMRDALLG